MKRSEVKGQKGRGGTRGMEEKPMMEEKTRRKCMNGKKMETGGEGRVVRKKRERKRGMKGDDEKKEEEEKRNDVIRKV